MDRAITPQELMNINRDHYEGTEFDLTKGIAAGPYGEPNRFDMSPQVCIVYVEEKEREIVRFFIIIYIYFYS